MDIPLDIKKILEYAITAPSGDNCQPWNFSYSENQIDLFNNPNIDASLYSWGQRSSLVSHGAVLQNIKLSAPSFGYNAIIYFFPDINNKNHIARITFEKITAKKDEALLLAIMNRTTNRKVYYPKKISQQDWKHVAGRIEELKEYANLALIEDVEKIKEVADIVSTNEQILFEHEKMHSFFYSHINWTKEEDLIKKRGFYLKTLELPAPALVLFKLFRSWKRLSFLNKIFRFSKKIAHENSIVYSSGVAMGLVTITSGEPLDYVKAGMFFQQLWIACTEIGLSLQPLTGILFLHLRLQHDPDAFSKEHSILIRQKYEALKNIFNSAPLENLVMAFRVGYAPTPSAKASRCAIDQFIIS